MSSSMSQPNMRKDSRSEGATDALSENTPRGLSNDDPLQSLLDRDSSSNESESRDHNRTSLTNYMALFSTMINPITGADDSKTAICIGWCALTVVGILLGSIMPSDPSLSSPFYRWCSNCVGYMYFVSWSVSFYPQLINNYRRKTTVGLSADFAVLNVIGFACYTMYVCALYYSATIQDQYRDKYGRNAAIAVQSNDVAFAVHALMLTILTLGQIAYYDGLFGQSQGPSKLISRVICVLLTIIILTPTIVVSTGDGALWQGWTLTWLDYFYLLSFVKIGVTLIKYVPQVHLNYQRKSTLGWSIWQIILDFSGGILSDLQLVGDCYVLNDWSGITGNLAKLVLGLVSITFDTIFMLQHYVWYADGDDGLETGNHHACKETIVELLQ
ncbi:hypothetical protein MPSEU_001014500 [Mayamaea pseudoterrestris]|nr:hypothetical protein MPSEU_001014500 [Mayamaea pseudoterrestris]